LLSDPWELTPVLALPAITWLAIAPQRLQNDPLTRAGPGGALYRRLLVLLTLHSVGSQQQPGLNFLDRAAESKALESPLDARASTWTPVNIDERLDALEELYLHLATATPQSIASTPPEHIVEGGHCTTGQEHTVWASADQTWMEVRQHVLQQLALAVAPSATHHCSQWYGHDTSLALDFDHIVSPLTKASSTSPSEQYMETLLSRQATQPAHERVKKMLEYERMRACLFLNISQRVALDAQQMRRISVLSLSGCQLSHVTLHGMCSLISLDLSSNAPLLRINGLSAQTQLERLFLQRNDTLCGMDALPALMSQLLQLRTLRILTLPFYLLDTHHLQLGGSYDDWSLLTVR